ncbi:MAG TPA: S1-like domain-containing RNA-binding protein [Thermodesulfovibrionales bacterium]|nr:S1-like domain-containing RNA-binding protein [Thermodesulfovibrionales bacterium]
MVEIGKFSRLRAVRKADAGVWLDGMDAGDIFMPRGYAQSTCTVGEDVEVFVFPGPDGQLLATTDKPLALAGEFALLKVASVTPVGAFLDWGLKKDLLVPFSEQKEKMEKGKSYIVYVFHDRKTGRIVASSKLNRFLGRQPADYKEGQRVELLICGQTEIGYRAIIDNSRWGILYRNEIFQPVKKGQRLQGFIKKMRDDGKIDLCLQKQGHEKIGEVSDKIIEALKAQGGFVAITDNSPAAAVYRMFGISKKTYKKAVGALYKKRMISIEEKGIRLTGKI